MATRTYGRIDYRARAGRWVVTTYRDPVRLTGPSTHSDHGTYAAAADALRHYVATGHGRTVR